MTDSYKTVTDSYKKQGRMQMVSPGDEAAGIAESDTRVAESDTQEGRKRAENDPKKGVFQRAPEGPFSGLFFILRKYETVK